MPAGGSARGVRRGTAPFAVRGGPGASNGMLRYSGLVKEGPLGCVARDIVADLARFDPDLRRRRFRPSGGFGVSKDRGYPILD